MSQAEEALALQLRAVRIECVREHRFHPVRKWRFDFAWPEKKVACEVEGGIWTNGRHTRGAGYQEDLEKYQEAMLLGWTVYRCSPGMVKSGKALETIEALLGVKS